MQLTVNQFKSYQRDGYLLLRGLISQDEVLQLLNWSDDLLHGRIELPDTEGTAHNHSIEEMYGRLTRLHSMHRLFPEAEQAMLHPEVVDVVEALTGPDVLALESMLFYNPPGKGGQGWHQDSLYVRVYPDTLIGAWMALDHVNEENGCIWVVPGSHIEPVHPFGQPTGHHNPARYSDLQLLTNDSHKDDKENGLFESAVASYGSSIPVVMEPGDVLFFHSRILHRSYPNRTTDRMRRAFVSHYCNARSWVTFQSEDKSDQSSANHRHVLVRGTSHLPYAKPKFSAGV